MRRLLFFFLTGAMTVLIAHAPVNPEQFVIAKAITTPVSPAPIAEFEQPASPLSVHFIDVGQGDSILIDLADTEILIDGGGTSTSTGLIAYLRTHIAGPLEAMVATHPHADHIGGLISVLENFDVQNIWHNGYTLTPTTTTYEQFMAAANSEVASIGATIHVAERGDQITAGPLVFQVLNPPQTLFSNTSDNINNNSIVLLLSYGNIDFLFTGDAVAEAETSMVNTDIIPEIEILKVGHHGSSTASTSTFLQAARPEIAIYMAGKNNTYGHPHQETITALREVGAKVYGTDVNGNIVVTTDGESYSVQPMKPPGDANQDGKIDALDITRVERIIASLESITPLADANLDGNVNALDITRTERIIVKLY